MAQEFNCEKLLTELKELRTERARQFALGSMDKRPYNIYDPPWYYRKLNYMDIEIRTQMKLVKQFCEKVTITDVGNYTGGSTELAKQICFTRDN